MIVVLLASWHGCGTQENICGERTTHGAEDDMAVGKLSTASLMRTNFLLRLTSLTRGYLSVVSIAESYLTVGRRGGWLATSHYEPMEISS